MNDLRRGFISSPAFVAAGSSIPDIAYFTWEIGGTSEWGVFGSQQG
jgi:hypothetical protein